MAELQSLRAEMNEVRTALVTTTARAEAAEKERSDVIRLAAQKSGGDRDDIVDGRGVGQPFKFDGRKDQNGQAIQDFGEWSVKLITFLSAKLGSKVETALKWAGKQRKMIQEEESADGRAVS